MVISAQNIDCGLCEAVLTSTHNLCFEQKYEKYLNFLSENFQFFGDKPFKTRSGRLVKCLLISLVG